MTQPKDDDTAEIAHDLVNMLKAWQGDMTAAQAAQTLGLPTRTYEGIKAGKGFRYPQMLRLAAQATTKNADP